MKKIILIGCVLSVSLSAWPIYEASNKQERKYYDQGAIFRQLGQGKWECTDRYTKDSFELEWCIKGWEYMDEKLENKKRDW